MTPEEQEQDRRRLELQALMFAEGRRLRDEAIRRKAEREALMEFIRERIRT